MELPSHIPVRTTNHSKLHEVDFNALEFGKYVSDHMLVCDFANGEWQSPQILPFANLSISPSALALHFMALPIYQQKMPEKKVMTRYCGLTVKKINILKNQE